MKKGRKKMTDGTDAEISEEVLLPERDEGISPRGGITDAARTVTELLRRHRLTLIRTVLPVAYALLFGGTGFDMGIYPFGISAVCAAVTGAPAFITAAGAAVSSLFVRGGVYIGAVPIAAAAVLRLIQRFSKKADGTGLRAVFSIIAGVVQSTAYSLSGGVTFYELCGILLSAAICPALTVSLRGLFSAEGSGEAGVYALLYTCLYALRGLSFAGASAAIVISMLATLYAAYSFGIHRGVVTGVAAGLAADPRYFAIYAAAAAVSGSLMKLSPIGAVSAGTLTALAFGIRSAGAEAFGTLFPELMFSAAVAGPLLHYGLIPKPSADLQKESRRGIGEGALDTMKTKIRALSDSLGSVGTVMRRMSKVFSRPSYAELRQMCDDAFDESCQACRGRSECWDREYRATASAVGRMAADIRQGKTVGESALPEGMRSRCPYSGAIISRINMGAVSATKVASANDSTAAAAEDYTAMSRLLSEIAEDGERESEADADASDALAKRLRDMGLRSVDVSVYGDRRRTVILTGLEHGCSFSGEELCSAAESVLDCRLTTPEYKIDGRRVSLEMHTEERFAAESGRCSLAKRGEQCGDSITAFKGGGGYFYALVSDGMGSGGEAAVTSGACAMFLERMLSAGCSLVSAAEMLNSFLTRRNMECFATVDLLEADLITGELRFLKSGAAPSFVLRDGKLFRLASKTVPVGIITPYDGEMLTFTARAGDYVIMLSDGAVPDGEDPSWLYGMLCGKKPYLTGESDLRSAAEGIAKTAAEHYGYADDVTVGIIRITPGPGEA